MKSKIFIAAALVLQSAIFIPQSAMLMAQNYQWANSIGSTGYDYGYSIAVDGNANVYITGSFQGTVDFDPSNGATANLTSAGLDDICFAKYAQNGSYLWAKKIGSVSDDHGYSIAVDDSGNVYITGYFDGIADFDPSGTGTANLTSAGGAEIFFAKYDQNGNYLWAKNIGSTSGDIGNSIAVDGSVNVLITGYFDGTADFDPSGAGTANLISVGGSYDIFFAKYDQNGNYLWAKNIGSSGDDIGFCIVVDDSANVYITGYFDGTADFNPSGAATANLTPTGSYDIFFAKYDQNGNYFWAKNIGSSSDDQGRNIAVDGSANVYITGWFQGTADFDPSGAATDNLTPAGGADIFFAKYDQNGNYLWAKNIGSTSSDLGYSIAVDGSANVYITGYFDGTADFDPSGAATSNLISAGAYDIFFAKYDQNGNYLYAKNIGGTSWDLGYSITVDGNGNVYITGYFDGTADFDPSNGATANLTTEGSYDIFFAKYYPTGASITTTTLEQEGVVIYPNPTTGKIKVKSEKLEVRNVEIYNVLGEKVFSPKNRSPLSNDGVNLQMTNEIDLSHQPDGIYFLKLQTNNNLFTQKIIISK